MVGGRGHSQSPLTLEAVCSISAFIISSLVMLDTCTRYHLRPYAMLWMN